MTQSFITARRAALFAGSAAALATFAGQAHAAGFYLQEQSVKATGRAFSGEVSEEGAQQMWWNPASIGGITSGQAYIGLDAILPRADSSDRGTTIVRPAIPANPLAPAGIPASVSAVGGAGNKRDPVNDGYLPTGGAAMPLNEHWAIGITATSPFSFTSNAGDTWARYNAAHTRLRTYDLQPVIAFATGGLSIGAGPNIERTSATFANALPDPLPLGTPDGYQSLHGSGWNVGWSAGFQFHTDKVDMGVSYKSAIKHTLKGSLTISGLTDPLLAAENGSTGGVKARFDTPWQVNAGLRYHLTRQLTVETQVTRFGWEKFDAIDLSGNIPAQAPPENYHNTWAYAVGFDYLMTPRWTLRGGVQRDVSPISAGNRDPRVPDGSRWNFALGSSYALTKHVSIDASASYDKIKSNPIDKVDAAYAGTPLQTVILTDGELHNAKALVFGLGGSLTF